MHVVCFHGVLNVYICFTQTFFFIDQKANPTTKWQAEEIDHIRSNLVTPQTKRLLQLLSSLEPVSDIECVRQTCARDGEQHDVSQLLATHGVQGRVHYCKGAENMMKYIRPKLKQKG